MQQTFLFPSSLENYTLVTPVYSLSLSLLQIWSRRLMALLSPMVKVRLESFSFGTQPISAFNNSECFPLAIFLLRPKSLTAVIVFSKGYGTILIAIAISVTTAFSFRLKIRRCKETNDFFNHTHYYTITHTITLNFPSHSYKFSWYSI